jgi:hypothetical protein
MHDKKSRLKSRHYKLFIFRSSLEPKIFLKPISLKKETNSNNLCEQNFIIIIHFILFSHVLCLFIRMFQDLNGVVVRNADC